MLAGIREIMIITTPKDQGAFKDLLGDGGRWGLSFEFAVQRSADGLAQAFIIAADFIAGAPSCLILGDNILYGDGLSQKLQRAAKAGDVATIFGYCVDQPERYGVIDFDADGNILDVEEKPQNPKSQWAAVGIYFYGPDVVDLARSLKPSARGELEITDLNNLYIRENRLRLEKLGRGFAWFDAGTYDSLMEAAEFVRVLQQRQGHIIAAPEEIAFLNGWIDRAAFEELASKLAKTNYGRRLLGSLTARYR